MQIKTILVPTDFSADADAALDNAVDLAKAFDAKLELFHAFHLEVPPIYGGFGGDFSNPIDILEPVRQAAEGSMDDLVKRTAARGVAVRGRVVMEHAAHAILDEAERVLADMIVMGTRGLSGLEHLVLGSTAERVVRMAHCPVMTIRRKT